MGLVSLASYILTLSSCRLNHVEAFECNPLHFDIIIQILIDLAGFQRISTDLDRSGEISTDLNIHFDMFRFGHFDIWTFEWYIWQYV